MLDVNKFLIDKWVIEVELEGFGICINKFLFNIIFKKKDKGGLNIISIVFFFYIDYDEIKVVMSEYWINLVDIVICCDVIIDDLIDVFEVKSCR